METTNKSLRSHFTKVGKIEVKSVLQTIIKEIYGAKDLEEGKAKMKLLLDQVQIKQQDKQKMIYETNNIGSLTKLQFYATNAMLKYEGLGVGNRN